MTSTLFKGLLASFLASRRTMEHSSSGSSHPRFPPIPAAAPPHPTSCIDEALPQIFFFALSFLIVGALLSVSFGSGLEEEEEENQARSMKKKKKQGLSPATVTSFLLVPFGAAGWGRREAGECAVCLAVFGGDDTLRVLPGCGHGYHAECIDPWLLRHATCPLCRNDLASPQAIAPGRRHVIDDVPLDP